MTEKTTKTVRKRAASTKPKATRKRVVDQSQIAERAYFIYLDEGRGDSVDHWLRAERELAVA